MNALEDLGPLTDFIPQPGTTPETFLSESINKFNISGIDFPKIGESIPDLRVIDNIVLSLVYEVNGLQSKVCNFTGLVTSETPVEPA